MQGAGCGLQGAGCRVQGLTCRVWSAGCRVQGAGCRVQGAGCRVQGAGCRVQGGLPHPGVLRDLMNYLAERDFGHADQGRFLLLVRVGVLEVRHLGEESSLQRNQKLSSTQLF